MEGKLYRGVLGRDDFRATGANPGSGSGERRATVSGTTFDTLRGGVFSVEEVVGRIP